jgi:hypothetical protein
MSATQEHGSMRKRGACPSCSSSEVWAAPQVTDETWSMKLAMPAAWRRDGVPMGVLGVCACGACGLVEWHTDLLEELEDDDQTGVRRAADGPACAACGHAEVWVIAPMRDVRSGLADSAQLAAHTRGLAYAARGKRNHGDEPIEIDEENARVRDLGVKHQLQNLLSHGVVHGRPVGHLEVRVCAGCGFTDWFAHGAEEARKDGKAIDHGCTACGGEKALELPSHDLRATGINEKRVALGRTDWGTTRADMVLRVCDSCSRVEWYVGDVATLQEGDAEGFARVNEPEGAGAYRQAPSSRGEESRAGARPQAPSAAADDKRHQLLWFAVAAVAGAVALYVLVHPYAAAVAFVALGAWYFLSASQAAPAPVALSEAPPSLEEDERDDDEAKR